MSGPAFEIVIVLVLILFNGVLALSEMAVVSSRKVRLQQQANQGSKSAQTALELIESPNNFLSTVQIGITLVGVLAGAFGGATVASLIKTAADGRKVPAEDAGLEEISTGGFYGDNDEPTDQQGQQDPTSR